MQEQQLALLDKINSKANLAGTNKMEILLFTLGTGEIFGINVFKVREVSQTPSITKTPNMPEGIEGVISLRGNIIPVIALSKYLYIESADSTTDTMIVTEFSRHTQGFLVHDVDRIIRVDWDRVKPPQSMLAGSDGMITAITELDDGRLVSILDVEQILANSIGIEPVPEMPAIETEVEKTVFFADDSSVARREIIMVLEKLGVKYLQANDGLEAWERLQNMASRSTQDGIALHDQVSLILTDAEMPELDGYVLTKNIKNDRRFDGIPVVMHSSLSSEANKIMGQRVGVDAYVAKFDPVVLAETIRPMLMR